MTITIEGAITLCEDISRSCDSPCGKEHQQLVELLKELRPKTGEWVEIENGEYLCSNCSYITIGYPPSYCPNCRSFNGGDEE